MVALEIEIRIEEKMKETVGFVFLLAWTSRSKKRRRCRGSNPGHPRDRREYSPLYYNDFVIKIIHRL